MLIFDPAATWDKIVLDNKSCRQVFFLFLVPVIFISVAAQAAGMLYLGEHSEVVEWARHHERLIYLYAVAKLILNFLVVFVSAMVVKTIAETFHKRNSYSECLIVMAYALSPLFLVEMFNAMPGFSGMYFWWTTFGVGIVLAVGTLYYGIPRVLLPDPPHAFGLYIITTLLVIGISALAALLPMLLLDGKTRF